MTLVGTTLIVSPTGSGNALGRALSLAELADHITEEVVVVAPDDGPLWPPAVRWKHPVERFDGPVPSVTTSAGPNWIWVVKPLQTSWKAGLALARSLPDSRLILDIDDDDAALSREFRSASLINWLRLNRARSLHPSRIDAILRQGVVESDAITVASRAVAGLVGEAADDALVVPHPRAIAGQLPSHPEGAGTEVGFFGTSRSHKGGGVLAGLLEANPKMRLHVFAGNAPPLRGARPGQIVEHPSDQSWPELFGSVHLVVLPQGSSAGAKVQLPAKLIDAMRFGMPIVTSSTAAIREVAGDTVVYVEDWADGPRVEAAINDCLRRGEELGNASRHRFESDLSLESQVDAAIRFFESIPGASGVRGRRS